MEKDNEEADDLSDKLIEEKQDSDEEDDEEVHISSRMYKIIVKPEKNV